MEEKNINTENRKTMIKFNNVSVKYPYSDGLKNVNVEFAESEFTFVLGPTGSGKSTLLRSIYMDIYPTGGSVDVKEWSSEKISARKVRKLRRNIGIVFQDFRLIKNMSVYENVALPLIINGYSRKYIKRKVETILDEIGLYDSIHQKAGTLSKGEEQRVSIARAVVKNPFVVLADEPTGNLDPDSSVTVFNLLRKINKLGTAIIMATHDYLLIKDAPYRRILMDDGKVIKG